MTTPDNRCGKCKWWDEDESGFEGRFCQFSIQPKPFWLDLDGQNITEEQEGTDCPCFEEKSCSATKT